MCGWCLFCMGLVYFYMSWKHRLSVCMCFCACVRYCIFLKFVNRMYKITLYPSNINSRVYDVTTFCETVLSSTRSSSDIYGCWLYKDKCLTVMDCFYVCMHGHRVVSGESPPTHKHTHSPKPPPALLQSLAMMWSHTRGESCCWSYRCLIFQTEATWDL